MRKPLLVLFLVIVFLAYFSRASFSYFSDTESVTIKLVAPVESPSSVTVLYENAMLTFFCHLPCCDQNEESSEISEVVRVVKESENSSEGLEQAPECFKEICSRAVLSGIYIKSEDTVLLENITVKWWGEGRLNCIKVDSLTFEVNSTAPAEVELGVTLEDGLHSLDFGFESLTLPAFEITFTFSDHVETIYFIP
ncbi:hypothetical protein GQS78_05555 [Thermococcus bergensis]|uniref:hypothetical protein n=1 Tax=Thermococcus bergensis TaxID=2689387 RepID=UPI001CEC4AD5|nr:hypothetical protein [Thermococcus bergensis]MCA6213723.1 hypothetical protein [Thermococcus bergensis]